MKSCDRSAKHEIDARYRPEINRGQFENKKLRLILEKNKIK